MEDILETFVEQIGCVKHVSRRYYSLDEVLELLNNLTEDDLAYMPDRNFQRDDEGNIYTETVWYSLKRDDNE